MSTALSPQPNLAWPAPGGATALNGCQKAAILVRAAIGQGVNIKLTSLPEAVQTELIRQMSTMQPVDQQTVSMVVEEFLQKFDAGGLSFPRELAEALEMLGETISPSLAQRMRKKAGISIHADPWARIEQLEADALLPVIKAESTEVAAVILSKLKVSKSAEILSQLPGDQARRIAYAISLTGSIAPRMVARIGQTIAEQLDTKPELEFTDAPVERVGAILNFSATSTREEVLEGLDKEDAEFASEVRKAIFTFANIPDRIDGRDISKITRDIDGDVLITALAGVDETTEPARDFILENMSKRMAESLREDMAAKGEVKPADAEAAMTQIVIVIRELEAAGEIYLVVPEDDD